MLGRREEELEREEVERQMREAEEAEMGDEVDAGFDEAAVAAAGFGEADGEDRDLDDEVPDADQTNLDDDEEIGDETGFTAAADGDGNPTREDTRFITGDAGGEGMESGMIDEDELMMGGDLDGDVPSAEQSRLDYDDDDDVDDVDGGEWQHTDTEEEIDDDESEIHEIPRRHLPSSHQTRRSTTTTTQAIGEDSEMMDMDITQASIEDNPPSTSIPQPHRIASGNAAAPLSSSSFITPTSSQIPTSTTTTNNPPPSTTTSTSQNRRRSWFTRSSPSNPPLPPPPPAAPTPPITGQTT